MIHFAASGASDSRFLSQSIMISHELMGEIQSSLVPIASALATLAESLCGSSRLHNQIWVSSSSFCGISAGHPIHRDGIRVR